MPDEGYSAATKFEVFDHADSLAGRLERTEADLKRIEAFATSSFLLTLVLLREMISTGQLPKSRAVHLVGGAINYLRRLYHLDELDLGDDETVDIDKLLDAMTAVESHQGAEHLLVEVLAAVNRR